MQHTKSVAKSELSGPQLTIQICKIAATWGTAVGFVRVLSLAGSPAVLIGTLRGLITATALSTWFLVSGKKLAVSREMLWPMLFLGIMNGFLPNLLSGVALGRIDSALAALLQASTPLFVIIGAHLLLENERLTSLTATGLVLGFAGVSLLIGPRILISGKSTEFGILAMLGVALSYAISTLYVRRTRPENMVHIVLGQQIVGAIPALALTLTTQKLQVWLIPWTSWLAFIGLSIISTAIPIVLYFRLLRKTSAGKASSVQYLIPVAAAVYGTSFLGEHLSRLAVSGGITILAGVWIAHSQSKQSGVYKAK